MECRHNKALEVHIFAGIEALTCSAQRASSYSAINEKPQGVDIETKKSNDAINVNLQ